MVVVICGVLAAFAFMLLFKLLWSKAQPKMSTNVVLIASAVLIGSLLMLAASGRVHWLAAAGTAVLPYLRRGLSLLRFAPFATRLFQMFGPGAPFTNAFSGFNSDHQHSANASSSETETDELTMKLDHATGQMSGTVLVGKWANRSLDSLSEQEILELYHSVGEDSQRLLGAYIQRYHPNLSGQSDSRSDEPPRKADSDTITPDRARRILGVEESASKEEIIEAHRRLMQKNHPDRGGSEYIAAEINLAKEVLLDLLP